MTEQPRFCQSCAMPIDETVYGTNADHSMNDEYCRYCYQEGAFTSDMKLDDMISTCVPHMVEAHPGLSATEAESMLRQYLPNLKCWQNA